MIRDRHMALKLFRSSALALSMAFYIAPTVSFADGILFARTAQEAQDNGNLELAIEYYTQALNEGDLSKKHQAYALNNRGTLFQDLNLPIEAEQDFIQSIERLPTYGDAYFNLTSLYLLQNKNDEALSWLNKALT